MREDRYCVSSCEGWLSRNPVDYQAAMRLMEQRVARIIEGSGSELIWVLTHPPIVTAGVSTNREHRQLAENVARIPVVEATRGGQLTYHDPGQLIVYLCLNLRQRCPDVRWFVQQLERAIIKTLKHFGIEGYSRDGLIGVWVRTVHAPYHAKIASIGLRLRRWVTFHGLSLNVDPDLSIFRRIIPCGVSPSDGDVSSLRELGVETDRTQVDTLLVRNICDTVGVEISFVDPPA